MNPDEYEQSFLRRAGEADHDFIRRVQSLFGMVASDDPQYDPELDEWRAGESPLVDVWDGAKVIQMARPPELYRAEAENSDNLPPYTVRDMNDEDRTDHEFYATLDLAYQAAEAEFKATGDSLQICNAFMNSVEAVEGWRVEGNMVVCAKNHTWQVQKFKAGIEDDPDDLTDDQLLERIEHPIEAFVAYVFLESTTAEASS